MVVVVVVVVVVRVVVVVAAAAAAAVVVVTMYVQQPLYCYKIQQCNQASPFMPRSDL